MALAQEAVVVFNPVSDIIKATVLSAFTFLSALSVRDVLLKTMETCFSEKSQSKLIFIYAYASIVVCITVILAFNWQK